jgi:putative transposase
MPNTYSQIYIQIVFAVKDRRALIRAEWDEELYRYITGTIQKKGQKMLAINGTADHIHFLIGMRPSCCLSDLVREIKKSSNDFVKENKFTRFNFSWQEGFGAFSYGQSQLGAVLRYVLNQKKHHAKRTFRAEYEELLNKFDVEFEDEYLFEWIEE